MTPSQSTVHAQALLKAALSIFLLLVLVSPSSLYVAAVGSENKTPLLAASVPSGGRRADVFQKSSSDEVGVRTSYGRCFHDSATAEHHKVRLREIPRSSQSSWACTVFPGIHRREGRVENPRCQSNPALELVADGCHIEQFDPHTMFRLLHKRTLYLVGDSLMGQWVASMKGCLLAPYKNKVEPWVKVPVGHGFRDPNNTHVHLLPRDSGDVWASYSPDYRRIQEVPDGLEDCPFFSSVCTGYSDGVHTTTICGLPQRLALYPLEKEYASCWKKMKETDIVVVNFSLHANTHEHIWAGLQNFVSFVKNSRSSGAEAKLPNLIWRESSQQHFQTPGGSYPYGNPGTDVVTKNLPCSDISLKEVARNEFRNKIMLPVIRSAGIPVLPVWQLTATDSKHHPGRYGTDPINDCTHFCMYSGSVLDSWAAMLQNLLEGLTAQCDGRAPFQECLAMTSASKKVADTLQTHMRNMST